jgi:chromosome segregation ATPase
VSRTLDVSKKLHKEANECAAALTKELEALETRYEMSRKVSERMLTGSGQTNASKDERIKILTLTSPPVGLRQALDDKQVDLQEAECRLVATQRQVETLNDQLIDAKGMYTEAIVDNKKLECQLGEAQVRLDHDYQDEERLKAELEKAWAKLEECKECADCWQRIAVGELDNHAPAIIG